MKLPHQKFCILPWVSLETSPLGTARPCCLALDEIVNDGGYKFHLKESDLITIRTSEHMKDLRRKFLAGEQPSTCGRCWAEEDSGRISKRMHTLQRLKHIVKDESWTEDAKPLLFLDLKLGNICNLKCRICGSWSSSTYAVEELNYVENKKNNYHYIMLKEGRWPKESQNFWKNLYCHLTEIRYIEFTGGEPFMIGEHFDLLQRLIDMGVSQNIEIHYNTNGTQWPENFGATDIWPHFKHVEIAFSIDDIGQRFEYQRSNADWGAVCENLAKYKKLRDLHSNISLQVCCTINIFNIMYINEVASWIQTQGFNFVYWNMLHDPAHFSIASLPVLAKSVITKHLSRALIPQQYRPEMDRVIEFMNQGQSQDGMLLKFNIKLLDQRRNQDLRILCPELCEAIDYVD